jgi:hypothetical protein
VPGPGGEGASCSVPARDRLCSSLDGQGASTIRAPPPRLRAVLEKICNGEDATQIAFNKVHCVDVGVDEGGWGAVVAEVRVEKT